MHNWYKRYLEMIITQLVFLKKFGDFMELTSIWFPIDSIEEPEIFQNYIIIFTNIIQYLIFIPFQFFLISLVNI